MRDTDESLLKSFAINRDEAAFRTLAERYLGLVFHTALRRTANRPLAEEVSQNILCALANKAASLARNPDLLPAWLHRATLFESSKAMRSESSYQGRKQLKQPDAIPSADSPWSDAIPHLDRALDQLARMLRSKGVALSATGIAAGLTAELAKAAPVQLLHSATAAVLTGTATYSTTALTLMFAAKSKALVPIIVLLCLTPLVLQQVAISKARSQNDALRTRFAVAEKSGSKIRSRAALVSNSKRASTNIDILVLVEEQDDAQRSGGLKQMAFAEKLAGLSGETLSKLIQEGAVLRVQRDK